MKNRTSKLIALILALTLSFSLLTGCGDGSGSDAAAEAMPAKTYKTYDEVLDAVRQGLSSGEDGEYFAKQNFCMYYPAYAEEVDDEDNPLTFGYTMLDIDEDEKEELIIGVNYDGDPIILDLFKTYDDGVKPYLTSNENDCYYMGEDNVIYDFDDRSDTKAYYCKYQMSEGEMILCSAVIYNEEANEENPWFYSTTGLETDDAQSLTDDEAQEKLDELAPILLELKPLM